MGKIRFICVLVFVLTAITFSIAIDNNEQPTKSDFNNIACLDQQGIIPVVDSINNGRVLLVDDYLDLDENENPLDYQIRRRFYERWGVHHFDYDIWVVADSGGFPDSSAILNYQVVMITSDGEVGESDGTWWYEVAMVSGGVLRHYLGHGGHLLAIGQNILYFSCEFNPPFPGAFEYDWFGISDSLGWDNQLDFTWAVNAGNVDILPDSMMIDSSKNSEQVDYAENIYSFRDSAVILFTKGLDINGEEPIDYGESVGHIFYIDGEPVTSMINFSLYFMPNEEANVVMEYILRDTFGCTYIEDPVPLPPWRVYITAESHDAIKLTWQAVDEDDVTAIKIYRAIFDGAFELFATIDPEATEYLDTDISPNTEYNYRLSCIDAVGQESEFSPIVTEYGGRSLPPTNLRVINGNNSVDLIWTNPDDPVLANFEIYKRIGISDEFELLTTLEADDSCYTDDNVVNMTSYFYYVISISEYGVESYPSDTLLALPYQGENREGILVVNSLRWNSNYIVNFYSNEVPWGYQSEYRVWDLLNDTYLDAFPDPDKVLGNGDLPSEFFDIFNKIVWVGDYGSDIINRWLEKSDDIMDYLNTGGNLLLITSFGERYLFDDLYNWCEVTSVENYLSGFELQSVHDSLTDVTAFLQQAFLDAIVSSHESTIPLFEFDGHAGGGFYTRGQTLSGNFVYIAGMPFRYTNYQLRDNVDIILRYFFEIQTDVEDNYPAIPDKFMLSQNYPNPFNPVTSIMYGVPNKSHVKLEVYDILGRKVNTLVDSQMDAGYHTVIWNGETLSGESVASGIYFYRLSAGDYTESKKMTILK